MDLQFQGRTALVTGSSQGIGRAIAKMLAAEGVRVAMVARRESILAEVAGEIVAAGGAEPFVLPADVMVDGAPRDIARRAVETLGHVDILVNSAGGSRLLPVDSDEELWEEALTLNFRRVRQLAHALLPQMQARNWGRIINITGKSEPEPTPGKLNAAMAAKASLHIWSKALSREVGSQGITVNCIGPGKIMSEQIRRKYTPEERDRIAREEIPMGHFGEPEDIGALAVFLASSRARYITGTIIPVDGSYRRYAY